MAKVFQYELCSYPPALFENKCTPREASKATLADALWKCMPGDIPMSSGEVPIYFGCSTESPGRVAKRMEMYVNSTRGIFQSTMVHHLLCLMGILAAEY